jgi:hypothetical protein
MEFLLVLSEDVELVATEEDHQRLVQQTGEYVMRLVGQGRVRGGGLLRPAAAAKAVRSRGGSMRVLDGPFAEGKEVIAGYLVIEADSLDEAVKIASDCPNAAVGSVEVRQVMPNQ